MALDRTWYNTLVDDSGSNTDGSVWDKADVDALMDAIDAELPAAPFTWTPVIGGSGGTSGQTYVAQQGTGIKAGRHVTLFFAVQLSAKGTITTSVQIQGFPYTADSSPAQGHAVAVQWRDMATNWITIYGHVNAGGTSMDLQGATAAAATAITALTTTDIGNDTRFFGTVSYLTA